MARPRSVWIEGSAVHDGDVEDHHELGGAENRESGHEALRGNSDSTVQVSTIWTQLSKLLEEDVAELDRVGTAVTG